MDRSLHHVVRPSLKLSKGRALSMRVRRLLLFGLFTTDQILVFAGFALAYWMRYKATWPAALKPIVTEVATRNWVPFGAFVPITALLMLVLAVLFATKGLYRIRRDAGLVDQLGTIGSSTITGIAVLIVFVFLYRPFFGYSRLVFAFAGFNIVVLLSVLRVLVFGISRWLQAHGIAQERVLVVGGHGLGLQVMNGIAAQPGLGYTLVGYLDDQAVVRSDRATRVYRHVGRFDDLATTVERCRVHQVIIALPFTKNAHLPQLIQTCRSLGVDYQVAPDLYQLSLDQVNVLQISGVPLISPKQISLKGWNLLLKRCTDVAVVLATAPATLVIAGLLALLVRLDSPGPVLFRQRRVGKDGSLFVCYKFRTMVRNAEERRAELVAFNEADGPLFKMRRDPRITNVGRLLRRSSLDELPQLWNVLRGDMSLIGPRPALPEEVACYEPWHHRRLEVSPGMAGLGQALGRSDISFDEMVRLDIFYAENWSLSMDLRILLMIIPAVVSGRGAY